MRLPCARCEGACVTADGVTCEPCGGSGEARCERRGCAQKAIGFNDDGEALCEDCLAEWATGFDEGGW
jgi:hypothetical protein